MKNEISPQQKKNPNCDFHTFPDVFQLCVWFCYVHWAQEDLKKDDWSLIWPRLSALILSLKNWTFFQSFPQNVFSTIILFYTGRRSVQGFKFPREA